MRSIRIAEALLNNSDKKLTLGIVTAKVTVEKKNEKLWENLQTAFSTAETKHKTTKADTIDSIKAVKETYKKGGLTKLSDFPGSNEALLKRAIAGKGIYQINSVVDANNLISIESLRSVGSYDLDKVTGDIEFRLGVDSETYESTSKASFKLAKLPLLADATGPFGSPTSDSKRALISETTTNLMTVIFSFDGDKELNAQIEKMGELLKQYAAAENVQYYTVKDQAVQLDAQPEKKPVSAAMFQPVKILNIEINEEEKTSGITAGQISPNLL